MDERLADILAPTLRDGLHGAIVVADGNGTRIGVVPLTKPTGISLQQACLIYAALGRGVLVLA